MTQKELDLPECRLIALVRPLVPPEPPEPARAESDVVHVGFRLGRSYASERAIESCHETALSKVREIPEFDESVLNFSTPQGAGFVAGARGHDEPPPYVAAWRFGYLPDLDENNARRSHNHVQKRPEEGVSVVEVYGTKNPHVRSIHFLTTVVDRLEKDWPRIVVAGWLSRIEGQDGEPLLCGTKLLDDSPRCAPNPFRGCISLGWFPFSHSSYRRQDKKEASGK